MPASRDLPISVMLEQARIERAGWSLPTWRLMGVVAAGDSAPTPVARTVREENGRRQVLWSGLYLHLYRDEAESYWHNLLGHQPSLFVVFQTDAETGLRPSLVSADYDVAGAYMEADSTVFSAPMPPEIYRTLEAYVMRHYRPQENTQRKRKGWKHDSFAAPAPRAALAAHRRRR